MRWHIHKVIALARPWVAEWPGAAGLTRSFNTWDQAMAWATLVSLGQV